MVRVSKSCSLPHEGVGRPDLDSSYDSRAARYYRCSRAGLNAQEARVIQRIKLGACTIGDRLTIRLSAPDITPERVLAFFACDRVTKTRGGDLKARVSVLKTQRVLRQMLVWAEGAGLVEKAPVPEAALTIETRTPRAGGSGRERLPIGSGRSQAQFVYTI